MKEKILSLASVFSAIAAALCWSGGLILASLGLGSIGVSYFSNLTKYKPVFTIITALLLYKSYSLIEKKKAGKTAKVFFWISAIISILILYYPFILSIIYS